MCGRCRCDLLSSLRRWSYDWDWQRGGGRRRFPSGVASPNTDDTRLATAVGAAVARFTSVAESGPPQAATINTRGNISNRPGLVSDSPPKRKNVLHIYRRGPTLDCSKQVWLMGPGLQVLYRVGVEPGSRKRKLVPLPLFDMMGFQAQGCGVTSYCARHNRYLG